MKRSWFGMAVLVMALVMVVACGKPPQAEIDAAKAALEAARAAAADKWAETDYQTAESSLSNAEAEVDAQAQKWFKNYDKAKELMETAKADAERAAAAAVANKETAKNEATAAIADATTALEEAKTALAGAPKGKDTKADLELFKQDLEGLAATLTEAQAAMDGEDYYGAKDKASSVKEKATSISDQIAQAAAKRAGRRK
jgi:hypothetical protein